MPAKNGSLTAQIDNMLLHSSYNPEREANTAAQELTAKNKETVIFMGAGLGWQICELAKMMTANKSCAVKKLVLIEPDPIHFFGALYYVDWSAVFEIEALILAVGCPADSVISLIEGNSINTGNAGVSAAYVYAIPSFILHARPYFDSVIALIERNRTKNDINAATYKKFEKLWIRNSITNIKHIPQCRTVSDYAKAIEGNAPENFIVVAAGPSLESILPQMPLLKKHAVIVCVETALHALLRAGVEPDFIVITDPQYYAYKHIAGLESPSSVLVCPLSVYPAVFRFKCRQIILCSEMFPVSGYFEAALGNFGDLGAGGSVASSAWNLCRILGAKNIYFAGLDLAYTSKQTHIKGSSAEQSFHTRADRMGPLEKQSVGAMFSANPQYGTSYDGNKVLTDDRMKMFAWWFESTIAANPGVKTWTLCPQGMKIPGVEVATGVAKALEGSAKKDVFTNATNCTDSSAFPALQQSFFTELHSLSTLINQAVEKCIIAGPNLQSELSIIEQKIAESPLEQIIALARPVTSDRLQMYSSLAKTMKIYLQNIPS